MWWNDEDLLTWVDKTRPPWGEDCIKSWDDAFPEDVRPFVTSTDTRWRNINMETVVGQWDHYAGQTWRSALTGANDSKMRSAIRAFAENPEYYFNDAEKTIYFDSVDGESWYTNGGGNHRTVVAKFAHCMAKHKTKESVTINNVHCTQFDADWDTYNRYTDLKKCIENNGLHISVEPRIDDTHQESKLVIFVSDWRMSKDGLFDHLKPDQFRLYAEWVVSTQGKMSVFDKSRYWWQWIFSGKRLRLVYPGTGNK